MLMEKYYIIGDLHGDFRPVRDFVQRNIQLHRDINNGIKNYLICLGDFGANFFFNYRDENYKEKLGKYPFTYFVIRGNHEERPSICLKNNPDKWHTEKCFGNLVYVENAYPYIKYAADTPMTYNIGGYNTLSIPGVYSVDKYHRLKMGWSWFENEQLTPEEMAMGEKIIKLNKGEFNLVLSHTCPIMFEPTDLFLSTVDQSMVDKTMERYLGMIEYNLKYSLWCWGHYHKTRIYPITEDKQQRLMLFNDKVIELKDWMQAIKKNEIGGFI